MASGRVRIVLGDDSLANYQVGAGHFAVYLQYLLGLRALGHEVLLLTLHWSTGDAARDAAEVAAFFARLREHGLDEACALLAFPAGAGEQALERATIHGRSATALREAIAGADLLWNMCCHLRPPLLDRFRHRVLVDLDPGHLQVSALACDLPIRDHQAFLSVGRRLHARDCGVPALGVRWHTFSPFAHLPLWEVRPAPPPERPFTSVTHWTWEELWLGDRVLSASKRAAYLRYLDLPRRAGRPFELAVHFYADDATGDRERLLAHGWSLADPWEVAATLDAYRDYLAASRGEILCPKPLHRELRTGWISDRSVGYLASGRPVLAEDTGAGDLVPTGRGLVVFQDLDEAVAGAAAIDRDWADHARAARELAEACFDARQWLPAMLAASG